MTVSNTMFSSTYNMSISVQSSIAIDTTSTTLSDAPVRVGANNTFSFAYESLGEPSCAKIRVGSEKTFAIGTSSAECSSRFGASVTYLGAYQTDASVWSFTYQFNTMGNKKRRDDLIFYSKLLIIFYFTNRIYSNIDLHREFVVI